jgi:FlaA1/EpsC-like NDP-sugar epimerase
VAQIENEYHNMLAAARSVSVEDLLGRSPVTFNDETVCDLICGKVVLVTGAGGSIGAELCRQMATFAPARLVLTDIYENGIYDLSQELLHEYGAACPPSLWSWRPWRYQTARKTFFPLPSACGFPRRRPQAVR